MGKKTKIFYWVMRGISIAVFATAILGLVLNFENHSARSTYFAYMASGAGMLIFTFVPNFLLKKGLKIPNLISNVYLVMISCAMLLGEVLGFYNHIKIWDSILHFSTPGILGLLAYSLINLLNSKKTLNNLNPFFTAMFVFSFIMTTGVLWEIFEFGMDTIFLTNMQRYRHNFTGDPFVGREALFDTMKDFILNTLGSIITSVVIYFDAKHSKYLAQNATLQKGKSDK